MPGRGRGRHHRRPPPHPRGPRPRQGAGGPERLRRHHQRPRHAQPDRPRAAARPRLYRERRHAGRGACSGRRQPAGDGLPELLPKSLPVHRVVHVDVFMPGCPPSADRIHRVLDDLLAGRRPDPEHARFGGWQGRPWPARSRSTRSPGSKATPASPSASTSAARSPTPACVTQFRGFERLCQGRPVHEMPSLMARICGICRSATWSPRPGRRRHPRGHPRRRPASTCAGS